MTFINSYTKPLFHRYYHTEEFVQNSETFIFAVGTALKLGLISCISPNGSIIWEKTYQLNGVSNEITFRKIIQLKPTSASNFHYIIYATAGSNHYLIDIKNDGTIIWQKRISWSGTIRTFNLAAGVNEFAFYISISDTTKFPFIGKLNSSGAFLFRKKLTISPTGAIINALTTHTKSVIIAGKFDNGASPSGLVIALDENLANARAYKIDSAPNEIHDIKFDGSDFFVTGLLFTSRVVYFLRFNDVSNPFSFIFPDSQSNLSKIQLAQGGMLYVLHYTGTHGVLNLLDSSAVAQWRKEINFDNADNGIFKIHYNKTTNRLTTDGFNSDIQAAVIQTSDSFESCKTSKLVTPTLPREQMVVANLNLSSATTTVSLNSVSFIANSITSTILQHCPIPVIIPTGEPTSFQSPNFYLQCVGSTGNESTKGLHNRWIFRGALGSKHLPKRNYAANSNNFNKPNDLVKLYRTKYRKFEFVLDLFQPPTVVDSTNKFWIYRTGSRDIYVYFKNALKYSQAAAVQNPLTNPSGFFQSYGNNLIEVENKEDLFFAVQLITQPNPSSSSYVRAETLTISEPIANAPKFVSNRKKFVSSQFGNMKFIAENGRLVRYQPSNCRIAKLKFEYYRDFIQEVNAEIDWIIVGEYGLNLNDSQVLSALEPEPNVVNGKWMRFNDNAFVKTANYIDRWNGSVDPGDRNLKQMVEQYINLSNLSNNPTAIEQVPIGDTPPTSFEVSNLELLNFASMDFHIARMLGLGTLDIGATVFTDSYVYVAEYTSFGDLEDGLGARQVQHLAMSLPTAIQDSRLPAPIEISEIIPGAFTGNEGEPSSITDEDGYTFDGLFRFVSIYSLGVSDSTPDLPFFDVADEFASHTITSAVYAGLEYKKNTETAWQKPELPNTDKYQNFLASGQSEHNETRPLIIPDTGLPLFVHKQTVSGTHSYRSYGINWFSRAASSNATIQIVTDLSPANPLIAPTNVSAHLIRSEIPLLFTSQSEQNRYLAIAGADKTVIRLSFDYHSHHEILVRRIPLDSEVTDSAILLPANANNPEILFPDNEEIFAERIEVFFRNQIPNNISGKALTANSHPTNILLSIITTGPYTLASQNQVITPVISSGTAANYVGGILTMGDEQYVIFSVSGNSNPTITVYKKEISESLFGGGVPSTNADNLLSLEISGDGLFMAVENMQNETSWGAPNPLSQTMIIGSNWPIHREVIYSETEDQLIERSVEKTRGVWSVAPSHTTVTPIVEAEAVLDNEGNPTYDSNDNLITSDIHQGLYKIEFYGVQLAQHSQFSTVANSVEWYQGIVRIFPENVFQGDLPFEKRRVLKVEVIENIGAASNLIVYARDHSFSNDPEFIEIQTGSNISVNFYPGYKSYIYKDVANGLSAPNILPSGTDEDIRYSIFGLRSHDMDEDNYSKIGVPAVMFAQNIIEPLQPEQPQGPLYATRPDFFGRSTYTFLTQYAQKPYGVLFYRGNDEAFLNALYEKTTIIEIRAALKLLGGNEEEYFTNRWQNFVNFTELVTDGDFKVYPPEGVSSEGYKFPNPDKQSLFEWANTILGELNLPLISDPPGSLSIGDSKIASFAKGAIFHAMNPLTETPIIYSRISSDAGYIPTNKKQVIKDSNGHALSPNSPLFDMAPMAKIASSNPHKTQYTDFTLDGTSVNIYFYGVKELGTQMKMGEFSKLLGPIKLVNTYPAEKPEIMRIMPVLDNEVLAQSAAIQLEVNAYPPVQNIRQISVYRSKTLIEAKSVRTMKLAEVKFLSDEELTDAIWKINDEFTDLSEIPYGDSLYYRVAVNRKVEFRNLANDLEIEYAPSEPSKISASVIVETSRPPSPVVQYGSKPIDPVRKSLAAVRLFWTKTCYNGTYHVYKMNNQGNWNKIYSIASNDPIIYVNLELTTWGSSVLETQNDNDEKIYHHFKVVAENTAGLLSSNEVILTIYKAEEWVDVATLPL